MKELSIIFRHFLMRTLREPIVIIFSFLLPIGLTILNTVINLNFLDQGDRQAAAIEATVIAALFMIAFQFFSSQVLIYHIYEDLRGPARWRLLATPVKQGSFLAGAVLASWIFSIIQGLLIIGTSALLFDMHWGNPFILVAVIIMVATIGQLMALLISLATSKLKTAVGITYAIGFSMMFLSGALFVPLGDSAFAVFVQNYGTPLTLAWRAIIFSGVADNDMSLVAFNMGVLGIIAAVMAGVVLILGRRRRI